MKTRCCHSSHFRVGVENERWSEETTSTVICMNQSCRNYLGETEVFSRRLLNRFQTVLLLTFILCFWKNDYSSVRTDYTVKKFSTGTQMIQCTNESLKAEIATNDIICPDQVYAQIVIESNHMSSGLFRKTNNLLGMRYPFRRESTASGIYLVEEDRIVKGTKKDLMKYAKANHYAVYDSWQECVADYKLWQDQIFKVNDRYLTFLGTYYAEDSLYVNKIKQIAR